MQRMSGPVFGNRARRRDERLRHRLTAIDLLAGRRRAIAAKKVVPDLFEIEEREQVACGCVQGG